MLWTKKDRLSSPLPCSIVISKPVVASFIQSTLDFPQRCLFIAAAISFFRSRTRDLPNHEFRKKKTFFKTFNGVSLGPFLFQRDSKRGNCHFAYFLFLRERRGEGEGGADNYPFLPAGGSYF